MLGSRHAASGYLQKSVTAITRSFNPSSKRVSVIEGEVEIIRLVDLIPVLFAQVETAEKKKSRIIPRALKFALMM